MECLEKKYSNAVALVERDGQLIKYTSGIQAREDVKALGGRILTDRETPGLSANHYILETGDKVLVVQYGQHGARMHIRAIVKKVNKASAVVEIKFYGKKNGEVRIEERTVKLQYVFRADWPEREEKDSAMLTKILEKAPTPAVEVRLLIDRLPDGLTWTYKPMAWRSPEGQWEKVDAEKALTLPEIMEIEKRTGWTMNQLGDKLSFSDWVYTFQRAS